MTDQNANPDPDDTKGDGSGSDGKSETEGLRTALEAERGKRQALERKLARLEGNIDALRSPGNKDDDKPREYSRADLQKMVDDGKITETEMDRVWASQIERKAGDKARREAIEAVRGEQTANEINREIDAYLEVEPRLKDEDSEVRGKVVDEFNRLVRRGFPSNAATELTAVERVLGPIEGLKKIRRRDREAESHDETRGDDAPASPRIAGKPPRGLKAEAREYYEAQIKAGRYKDWAAVAKELEFAAPGPRQRLGLSRAAA